MHVLYTHRGFSTSVLFILNMNLILLIGSEPYSREKVKDDDYSKKAKIREAAIKREFLHRASNLMMKMKVDLVDVKVTYSGYEGEMSEEACRATDIPSFLLALRGCVGPYVYESVSGLLISFCGEEGEKLVAEYEEKLECQLRPGVIPTQRNGKILVLMMNRRLDQTKELDFRNDVAKILKCSPKDFILADINPGSQTQLTYIIPGEIAERTKAVSEDQLNNAKKKPEG